MKHKVNHFIKPSILLGLITTLAIALSGCGSSSSKKVTRAENLDSQYAQQVVNLGPGVQEACVSAGGLPALTLELNGESTAVCQFANGKRCAASIIQSGACI